MRDTIFALSSGAPPAAIGIVRISGPQAHQAVGQMAGEIPPPRAMSLRNIRDPRSGEMLDRGLVVVFPAENSVTGEALAELHVHGGRAIVDAIEDALDQLEGLRRARAGEFTWRAFENGRLNLVQVESLSDLLRAQTAAQRRAAMAEEGLGGQVEQWRRDLLQLSALVEAALDQSDEDDVPEDRDAIDRLGSKLTDAIGAVLERPGAERLFDGVRVVFAGPPNSGKSTLINALAGRDVAITSPIAGTTRDVIEAPVQLGGVAFVLTDTAGLRGETGDTIERIGIERARRRIEEADLIVCLDDAPLPDIASDRVIPIHARADEPGRTGAPGGLLRVSAKTGEGLAELSHMLIERARCLLPREGDVALSRRQRKHLTQCHASLLKFGGEPDELIAAEHLRSARAALDELTGRVGTEDMLDALFATFCVGK